MTPSCRQILGICGLILGLLVVIGATALPETKHVGHFSTTDADSNGHPVMWKPISFGDIDTRTQYRLVEREVQGDTTTVVRAMSNAGAAGLGRPISVDPQRYSVLTWQWKVSNVLDKGNARTEDGDDYPARIYVTFDYDPSNFGFFDRAKYEALQVLGYDQIPTRALNYIWANRVDQGRILPNPFTDWVQMVAVESGPQKVGTWVMERRNVRADYRKAFGENPPPINGIAIMTDTDNTGESATAYYGDIIARRPDPRANPTENKSSN